MNASNAEDEGREQLIATDAKIDSVPAATPSPAANGKALIVGIFVAVAGAWIAANLADRFRIIENVEHGKLRVFAGLDTRDWESDSKCGRGVCACSVPFCRSSSV